MNVINKINKSNVTKTLLCIVLIIFISLLFATIFREHFVAAFVYALIMCLIPVSVIIVIGMMHILVKMMFR